MNQIDERARIEEDKISMPEVTKQTVTAAEVEPQLQLLDDDDAGMTLVGEFILFLKENKKWWLIPLILMILLLGLVLFVSTHWAIIAPFLYPLG